MKANFTIDPMYLTVFCIVRWIEKYHQSVDEKYRESFKFIPTQYIAHDRVIFGDDKSLRNVLDFIEYTNLNEMKLKMDIPNHRAKRFADFEYMSSKKLWLEEYDADFAEELIYFYAEKHNLEVVDFDDIEHIGSTIWQYIHNTQEWKDFYNYYLSQGYGDTGMGVYSKSLKHFIPCDFSEHKNAIYEMLRMFDEFKNIEDYEFYNMVSHLGSVDKRFINKMDYLVMNDFELVGNMNNKASYIR